MLAEQRLDEGDLDGALAALQQQIRGDPSNAKYRVFLFQLLVVLGQWERALTQLDLAAELDAGTLVMVQVYREALQCEGFRREVFAGRRSPLFFGKPESWQALLVEALRLTADGEYARAQELRAQAFDAAPATSGRIDEQPFEWIADADVRIGPMLEAIVNGRYYWIPFHYIRTIAIEEPTDLRDLVWMPARFMWANGGETVGLIPTRYPGSESAEDPQIRMARKTEWADRHEAFEGVGQRMIATDAAEHALMDIRCIDLDTDNEARGIGGTGTAPPHG